MVAEKMTGHCFPIIATYSEEENIFEMFYHLSPEISSINSLLVYPSPTNLVNFLCPGNWNRGLFCGRDSFSFEDNPLHKSIAEELSDIFLLVSGERNTKRDMIELSRGRKEGIRLSRFEAFGRASCVYHGAGTFIFSGKVFFVI